YLCPHTYTRMFDRLSSYRSTPSPALALPAAIPRPTPGTLRRFAPELCTAPAARPPLRVTSGPTAALCAPSIHRTPGVHHWVASRQHMMASIKSLLTIGQRSVSA